MNFSVVVGNFVFFAVVSNAVGLSSTLFNSKWAFFFALDKGFFFFNNFKVEMVDYNVE